MTFSWALRCTAPDYFLTLTDTACFYICPGSTSDLSLVVRLKHIQESPQIFRVACASAGRARQEALLAKLSVKGRFVGEVCQSVEGVRGSQHWASAHQGM